MLHTLNLSRTTRIALRSSLDALMVQHEVIMHLAGQHGAFLFLEARQRSAAKKKLTAPQIVTTVEDAIHMLYTVGYIPLVLPRTMDDRTVVEARARAIGKRAHLEEMEATSSHRAITWDQGTNFEDGTSGPRTGILRLRQPYMLFQVHGAQLELVATANPADAYHATKWIRAAERWRTLHPTRATAGTT